MRKSTERFIQLCRNAEGGASEVARKLGIEVNSVYCRARYLRTVGGYDIPKLREVRPVVVSRRRKIPLAQLPDGSLKIGKTIWLWEDILKIWAWYEPKHFEFLNPRWWWQIPQRLCYVLGLHTPEEWFQLMLEIPNPSDEEECHV